MKFWNQARLCLTRYDFEAHIMLSLCLIFQGTRLSVMYLIGNGYERIYGNSNVSAKCESLLRNLY